LAEILEGMASDKKPDPKPGEGEFARFQSLARRLLGVSKKELHEEAQAVKPKQRKKRD
jgi:hypothetical protein